MIIGSIYEFAGCYVKAQKVEFMGRYGSWYQFCLPEKPLDVWCELRENELHLLTLISLPTPNEDCYAED